MPAGDRYSALDAAARAQPAAWWRPALLVAIVAGSFAALMLSQRFGQDPAYHGLADRRVILGIPNFGDVVSNVAFLLVGAAGLRLCAKRRLPGARASWTVFFLGVALVSVGSAYYHWAPDNRTLVWDDDSAALCVDSACTAAHDTCGARAVQGNASGPGSCSGDSGVR
jgi:hypothetical protein